MVVAEDPLEDLPLAIAGKLSKRRQRDGTPFTTRYRIDGVDECGGRRVVGHAVDLGPDLASQVEVGTKVGDLRLEPRHLVTPSGLAHVPFFRPQRTSAAPVTDAVVSFRFGYGLEPRRPRRPRGRRTGRRGGRRPAPPRRPTSTRAPRT